MDSIIIAEIEVLFFLYLSAKGNASDNVLKMNTMIVLTTNQIVVLILETVLGMLDAQSELVKKTAQVLDAKKDVVSVVVEETLGRQKENVET